MPYVRHLVVEQAVEDYLQLLTHDHETVNSLVDVDEGGVDCL